MALSSLGVPLAAPPERRDYVYEVLRRAILSGQLQPGERIIESETARLLQVSRTPVRDALHRLLAEGLVSQVGGRGLVVTRFTEARIREIMEIRELLESRASRRAAERARPEEIDELRRLLGEMEHTLADPTTWTELNYAFHAQIRRMAGNQALGQVLDNLLDWLSAFHRSVSLQQRDRVQLQQEHRAIYAHIAARDADGAEAAAREHVRTALTYWLAGYRAATTASDPPA